MKNFSLDVNNRNIILFILFIGLFIFHGCSSSSDEGIGMNPNLSENNLTFSSGGEKKVIYAEKEFMTLIYEGKTPIVSIEKDPNIGFSSLATEWMSVKMISNKDIEIEVFKNNTNKERIDTFYVFNGNWIGAVIIKQEY